MFFFVCVLLWRTTSWYCFFFLFIFHLNSPVPLLYYLRQAHCRAMCSADCGFFFFVIVPKALGKLTEAPEILNRTQAVLRNRGVGTVYRRRKSDRTSDFTAVFLSLCVHTSLTTWRLSRKPSTSFCLLEEEQREMKCSDGPSSLHHQEPKRLFYFIFPLMGSWKGWWKMELWWWKKLLFVFVSVFSLQRPHK